MNLEVLLLNILLIRDYNIFNGLKIFKIDNLLVLLLPKNLRFWNLNSVIFLICVYIFFID